MPFVISLFNRWLSLVMAALLLLTGMPKLECCCTTGNAGEAGVTQEVASRPSCCGSGTPVESERGGCGCGSGGDCPCEHDLDGPPDLPPENPDSARLTLEAAEAMLPAPVAVVVPRPRQVVFVREAAARGRASPPPRFLINCVFRC